MTIKEVEEKLNLTRANIRFYEKEGLVITKRNPINGYRIYSDENIEDLQKIIFLRNLEISIEEISLLQNNKITMEELLKSHYIFLQNKTSTYETATKICSELIKNSEFKYDKLSVENYRKSHENNEYELLKDTISKLSEFKEIIIPWVLVFITVITALIAFPLLPEKIPVNWEGSFVTEYGNHLFIFIYPAIAILFVLRAKILIWNIFYRQVPHILFLIDEISTFITCGFVLMLFSLEIFPIMYTSGLAVNMDYVITTEGIIFIFILFLKVWLPKRNVMSANLRANVPRKG